MRPIRGILLIVALAGVGVAAPLQCPTTPTAMSVYDALGFSCFISDKLFSNFTYSPTAGGNGVPVPDTAVFVTADTLDPNNPGFHFASSAWTVSSSVNDTFDSFVDSTINFDVATLSGQALIDDNTLTLNAFSSSGLGFFLAVDEQYTPDPSGLGLHVHSDPFSTTTTDHRVFTPINALHVTKDLFLGAENHTTSTATITQFSENFSEIGAPEPLGFVLMGSGLIGLGIRRRSRK